MDAKKTSHALKPAESKRDFLLLFLPVALLVITGAWMLGQSRIQAELSVLMAQEKTYVELSHSRLNQELDVPIRHLRSLTREKPVYSIYKNLEPPDVTPMKGAFISLISRNQSYDQVRWLDEKGIERVRVNNIKGIPTPVPENALQDKHQRYYFKDIIPLSEEVIYISPLDLNIENGQIELPYKPALRIAIPIFTANGLSRGLLIINIAARSMLNAFTASVGPAAKRLMLLNSDGYWLKSPNEADEWGFMFQRETTLAKRHPDVWNMVSKQHRGQIRLANGLWTWNTVSPAPEQNTYLSHNNFWKIITHIPNQELTALENQVWPGKMISALIILILSAFGINRLIQAKNAQTNAEKNAALALSEAESAHRLQQAQASFQMLFEANNSGLLVVDANGLITMANPAFEQLFGYKTAEVLQRPVEILLPEHNQARHAKDRMEYFDHPKARSMGAGRDLFGTRKDGSLFPIEIGLSPYKDNNQHFVLASIIDISERKRIQDELLQLNDTLEKRVIERTAELQTAQKEAQRLANVKGNFLANMSHEIRTPMNAILGLAYLLEKSKLDTEELNLVKKIRIAGRSLLGIINDILDFSKIESGRLEIEQAPFRLNDVLDNVATLMSAVEYNINVELILGPAPEGMEYLRGDALRLEQILVNLLSNALKFTQQGSVTLIVEPELVNDGKNYLRFSVKDTGTGITAEKQAEIFSPFAQEDTSTSRRFGGTGLGLSICRCLVQMMKGEIGVISEPNQGSEFWFVIPVELIEPKTYIQPALAFQNVLIADDHPIARDMLAATVRSLGWIPEVLSSGEEAVQRTKDRAENNKPPDIILLDWHMPGTNGLEAAKEIMTIFDGQLNKPIIMIATAHDRESLLHEPDIGMINAVLNKPITASALYNTVSRVKHELGDKNTKESIETNANTKRLQQLRVLIVDDSEINRDMARCILELEDATVYLQNDGQAALDWLRANSDQVDVVLMDIQMPLMDGYEATHLIREELELTELPIIALTAGAFKNQQTAALEAGMNGFVAKPFDVDELIAYLQQFIRERNAKEISVEKNDIQDQNNPSLPVIDLQKGIKNWRDCDTYYRYLRKFVDAHGKDGDEIKALINDGRQKDACALAHKLKGTAGNLAIMIVWRLAEKVEHMLTENKSLDDSMQKLQSALDEVSIVVNRLIDKNDSNDNAICCITDNTHLTELLHDLMQTLDQDNLDAAESILSEIEKYLPKPMLFPVREQLDNFDFRAAQKQVRKLLNQLSVNNEDD